jgi:hypothetical protein
MVHSQNIHLVVLGLVQHTLSFCPIFPEQLGVLVTSNFDIAPVPTLANVGPALNHRPHLLEREGPARDALSNLILLDMHLSPVCVLGFGNVEAPQNPRHAQHQGPFRDVDARTNTSTGSKCPVITVVDVTREDCLSHRDLRVLSRRVKDTGVREECRVVVRAPD